MDTNTDALRGALTRWAENHETATQGWIAHGFAEGLALANRAPAKGFVGLTWLWEDEVREHIRRGRAAAGDRAIGYLYEEALKAGYQIGRDLIALNEEQAKEQARGER